MLKDIKGLLGIGVNDTDLDANLTRLITLATARLKNLLGNIDPPESLDYIIVEVVICRFNRIGSEGLSSHTVEGESLSFVESDFAAFKDDIQAYLDLQADSERGKVRFL